MSGTRRICSRIRRRPRVVAHGQAVGPNPCATCHLFNGAGSLGVPDLAGLPAAYMIEQIGQFRSGRRHSSEEMMAVAKGLGDAEFARACAYYAKPPRAWRRCNVVETARVPLTQPDRYGMLTVLSGGRTEPHRRPDHRGCRRLGHAVFPGGSGCGDDAGRAFRRRRVRAEGRRCTRHGSGAQRGRGRPILRALPRDAFAWRRPCAGPLAGRSAACLARAMEDIRTGARGGRTVAPMRPIARGLSATDVRNVAAYLASLKP